MTKVTTYRDARTNAEKIADEVVKDQVLKGIEFLTEEYGPDWVDHIDPSSLYLSSATHCVLGQLYQDKADEDEDGYADGYSWALDTFHGMFGHDWDDADYGFSTMDGHHGNWRELTAGWRTALGQPTNPDELDEG